nr:MAG TPA: putative receptor binding protein [Caudoviricetes sp.]
MRKFAFVVFDIDNSIIDRFPLDVVTDLSGLGWRLKLSKIEGDVTDTVTKVVQEKQSVGITINLIGRGYEKFTILSQWLQKYSAVNASLALEYNDGVQPRYVEGKVTELKKTEKDEYNNLSCAATFTPLTPFFVNVEQTITINLSSVGKNYPFKYPYCYGKNEVRNNEIDNLYLASVPVTVMISGPISAPLVELLDENGTIYNTVSFPDVTLITGQYIIVNSATRKIWYFNGMTLEDYSAKTDPSYDTFLFAKNGISTIKVNIDSANQGSLTGSWRQYGL